jgi:hypothetical protein
MMLKNLILTCVLLTLSATANADKYLGDLDKNPYNPNSVSNPYGKYGSEYSPDSINNKYGQYGSEYSSKSANNPYATEPPKIIEHDGKISVYGRD